MESKKLTRTHIHIDIIQAMEEPERFMPLFEDADGGELQLADFMEFLTKQRMRGYTKLPLGDCDIRLPDGSCAGHPDSKSNQK